MELNSEIIGSKRFSGNVGVVKYFPSWRKRKTFVGVNLDTWNMLCECQDGLQISNPTSGRVHNLVLQLRANAGYLCNIKMDYSNFIGL